LIVADCAEALRKNAGAATPRAKADVKLRRVKFVIISSTHRPDSRVLNSLHAVFKAGMTSFVYSLLLTLTGLFKIRAICHPGSDILLTSAWSGLTIVLIYNPFAPIRVSNG
jgi:hypothetical protein